MPDARPRRALAIVAAALALPPRGAAASTLLDFVTLDRYASE